jgi:polyhydroxyalkanoate synthesis regulator phasin
VEIALNVNEMVEEPMIELIKKAVLTGVGVAALTKEKVEELSQDIVEKTKMSESEGEKFVKEMLARADESKEAIKEQTDKVVKNVLGKMQLAKSEEVEALKKEIEMLRSDIERLQQKGDTPAE